MKHKARKKVLEKNHQGQRFGSWSVNSFHGNDKYGYDKWNCTCDCGTTRTVSGNSLRSRTSRSCGCQKTTPSEISLVGDVAHIKLDGMRAGGSFAVIDASDIHIVSGRRWFGVPSGRTMYAVSYRMREGKTIATPLHRLILSAPQDTEVDHRDGNGLNNLRSNLRFCLPEENNRNRKKSIALLSSRFKGVCKVRGETRFRAQIGFDGKRKFLGRFTSEEEAARAYDKAARDFHKEFSSTNFP